MPLYHTGLFSADQQASDIVLNCGPARLEKASTKFNGTPSQKRKYQDKLRRDRGRPPCTAYDGSEFWFETEVLIRAADLASAQRASNLLTAAIVVSDMGVQFAPEPFACDPVVYPAPPPTPFIMTRSGLGRACVLASRASGRRRLQYALHRLHLSYRSVSPHWIDLDPHQSPRRFGVTNDTIIHVYIANAITLAYSAIEDLEMEVRSRGQPSKMPDGSWNLTVREDLEKRLSKGGVDVREREVWTMRGPQTRIERRKKPPVSKKARWARGSVRDVEVEVIDAIALASWLRDKLGAHGLPSFAASLTAYDAHNVQSVARRLLMERLGLWRC